MRDHSGYSVSLRKPGTQEAWPELTGPDGRGYGAHTAHSPAKPLQTALLQPCSPAEVPWEVPDSRCPPHSERCVPCAAVCGVPGKPFEVVVTGPVHSLYNARAQGWQTQVMCTLWEAWQPSWLHALIFWPCLQAQLRVDGRCAGVSLWMSPHQPSAVFQGFAVSGKGGAGSFTQQQVCT